MRDPNWFQHVLRRSNFQPRRQAIALGAAGVLITLVVGVLVLTQVASTATLGRQLDQLVAERNRLERMNEQLRVEIAELKSVPNLLARAQALGFVPAPAESIEYLPVDGYDPRREPPVPPQEEQEDTVPTYDETFWGWLQQTWDTLTGQFEDFSQTEGN
jgi:hypothetical protein